jgi:O-antigen/teichoic acid export membrane protein
MRILKNPPFWDQLLVSGGNFLISLCLANALAPNQFGSYVLLWLGVQVVSSFQMALFVFPMFTNVPQKPHFLHEAYISAIAKQNRVFIAASTVIFYLYFWILGFYVDLPESALLSFAFPVAGAMFLLQEFYRKVAIVRAGWRVLIVGDIIAYSMQLLLVGVLLWTAAQGLLYVFGAVIIALITSTIYMWRAKRFIPVKANYASLVGVKNWKQSKYLFGASVLQIGGENIFIVVAGSVLGASATAAIRVMQNLMGVCNVFLVSSETTLAIQLAALRRNRDEPGLRSLVWRYLACGAAAFLVIFILAAVFQEQILQIFYGGKYSADGRYLKWFAVNYAFIFFTIVLRVLLRTLNASAMILNSTVLVVAMNLLLSWVIIANFGLDGAVFGLLLSNMIYFLLLSISVKICYDRKV